MTSDHHTPIPVGEEATSTVLNARFSDLDSAINSFGASSELTMDAAGAITVTGDNHTIDTFGGAATDNLDTISGMSEGEAVLLHAENGARTVVIRHGVDNIVTNDGADFSLDDTDKAVIAIKVGTNINCIGVSGSGGGLYSAYLHYYDLKTQNTAGGSSTSGSRQTRTITTEVVDTGGHGTLSSNQITLDQGTYRILIRCPFYRSNGCQIWWYNVTDTADELIGATSHAKNDTTGDMDNAFLQGRFNVGASTETFEVQYEVTQAIATSGLGVAANFDSEIYTQVELWKET